MARNIAKATPWGNEASIVFGFYVRRNCGEELAISPIDRRFENDALEREN